MSSEQISASHVGYLCGARKVAVVREVTSTRFAVQNMAIIGEAPLSASAASYQVILEGEIQRVETLMGAYGLCDFSSITQPGIYQVILPESGARTYQFTVADGVYHRLPYLFLDFIHELRSGYYQDDLRRPLTVDDGVRSDNGEYWDASGGWYDAGDLRKWMNHSTLPALAFMEISQHLKLNRCAFEDVPAYPNDWLTETAWGLAFILKMQDPETGMIFEDVGGGSTARRREGMSWWYENHSGCYADNADNRFTDNLLKSGDERSIRVQYNPIAQYTNLTILTRAYRVYAAHNADLSQRCYKAALKIWAFCSSRLDDEEHTWSFVRAWRACAALELYHVGLLGQDETESTLETLLETFDEMLGFWVNSTTNNEPYRGIIHAAQPLIALAKYLEVLPEGKHTGRVRQILSVCKERFILPMTQTNPYDFVPFGAYNEAATADEAYRPWRDTWVVRFCMPINHPQQINHGLAGHWMSWAHALAYVGQMLDDESWSQLAWAQVNWLLGNNHYDLSFVSGVGHNNPMPHSRFLGTLVGGFMNGFRGTQDDMPYVDVLKEAEWNSTEYWNVPLSNCLMALARLLPRDVPTIRKLG